MPRPEWSPGRRATPAARVRVTVSLLLVVLLTWTVCTGSGVGFPLGCV